MPKIKYLYTGNIESFTIPESVTEIELKLWGAAGGPKAAFNSQGGAGGYSSGIIDVPSGEVLEIMVGEAGKVASDIPTFGGGGGGGLSQDFPGSSGGGRSGVAFSGQSQFIIAGGGGGAGIGSIQSINLGGNGGGLNGNNQSIITGDSSVTPAEGGTALAGGSGGTSPSLPSTNGFDGTSLQGGTGGTEAVVNGGGGGGGGGGFFGGGGGIGSNDLPDNISEQAGGGGSGYLDGILRNGVSNATPQGTGLADVYPPNITDIDYIPNAGVAFEADNSINGDGLIVLILPDLIIYKSISDEYATIGDTLTYEISILNTGPGTLPNILLHDTIPEGTTFVPGSLFQDGTIINETPSYTGITLPNPLIINEVSTITFDVVVTSTIINPILNGAAASYGNTDYWFNSNQVSTTINFASLMANKSVDELTTEPGNTLLYTIEIENIGNVLAEDIIFIDTIPPVGTIIQNTFKQDGSIISDENLSDGVTLPNNILPGTTSTITFEVLVNTLPDIFIIENLANLKYQYTKNPTLPLIKDNMETESNIVSTKILGISNIQTSKFVNKTFTTLGDELKYTIVFFNEGNTLAKDLIFYDTLSNGNTFISNTIKINGILDGNKTLINGVTIPDISPFSTITLEFNTIIS